MAELEHTNFGRAPDRIAIRLMQMLDSIELAGFAPLSMRALHSYAYLANLLGELWDVDPLDGKILKSGSPYYPELREALDRLIVLGLADLVSYEAILRDGVWIGEGEVGLNTKLARPIIQRLEIFKSERSVSSFLQSLAFAVAPYASQLVDLVSFDVTWTDRRIGRGDVLDYAESNRANYTANVAEAFTDALPVGLKPSDGEKLQYYVALLEKRASSIGGDAKVA